MRDGQSTRANRGFGLLAALGALMALLGIALDLLPGTSPGLNFPQLLLILAGAALAALGYALRDPRRRRAIASHLTRRWLYLAGISLVTLLILEAALTIGGLPSYFPPDVPQTFLQPVPWWTCDEAGCHYVYEEIVAACQRGELRKRRCIVNRQGFHDTQDFVAAADHDQRLRVLILGDSFAFGGSAEIGKSFVETIERDLPDAIVWNTAIPGAGTSQALLSYQAFAPLLRPQIAILAFYMNDFDDNMMPVDSYFMGVDDTGYQLSIRQYQVDLRGALQKRDGQADLYYRYHLVEPPANEAHRLLGVTRLGALLLRTGDAAAQMISQMEGGRLHAQVDATRQALTKLRDAAQPETDLLLLLIPRREDLTGAGAHYQHAITLARELDLPYVDTLPLLESADYARHPDVHWSTAGHQKIGRLLSDCLRGFQAGGDFGLCA